MAMVDLTRRQIFDRESPEIKEEMHLFGFIGGVKINLS